MRKTILIHAVVFALVVLSGYTLMSTSQRVQQVERDIIALDHGIADEQEKIRVLNAEWAYLNDPARLEHLVGGEAGLSVPSPDHLLFGGEAFLGTMPSTTLPPENASNPASRLFQYNISYSSDDIPATKGGR